MTPTPGFQPTPVQPAQYNFAPPPQAQTSPMQTISQGLQTQGLFQQNQLDAIKLEEARRTRQAAENFQTALGAFVKSGKAEADFSALITATPPEHITQMAKMWDAFSEPKKKDAMQFSSEVVAALMTGNNDKAVQAAEKRAGIYEASGLTAEAAQMRKTAELAKTHPDFLLAQTAMGIVAAGGDKVLRGAIDLKESREKSELHGPQMAKATAQVTTAEAEAKYSEQTHATELAKKGWDIKKIQSDMAATAQTQRLHVMKAAQDTMTSDLHRRELELKINKAQEEQGAKVRERAADIDSARTTVDNMLNTADRLLATPANVVKAAVGLTSKFPTVLSSTADFEEMVSTFTSQAFLAQVPTLKGSGSLSNMEGDKLQASLQSLSLRQSKEQFLTSVKEVQRLLLKGRANLVTKYGLPESVPDRPNQVQHNIKVQF
jgi:hypothetical protein